MKRNAATLVMRVALAAACAAMTAGCTGTGVFREIMDLPEQAKLERVDQVAAVSEEQITGVPGSPSATMTIDGKQLPAPPQKFEGKIGRTAAESKPYWPARIVPPKGAPNVLLIMTDDAGYGVPSTFGGVIPTPALDRIANATAALHQLPFDGAVLADARGADHRPQPPLGRLRRHCGAGDRLPGLRQLHHQGQGDDRPHPEGQRLPHLVVRQEPQHAGLPGEPGRPLRPVADRHGLRVFLRLHGRRHQPVGAGRTSSATRRRSIPLSAIRART